ncbi:hypothetical protein KVR01_008734 [Diaporthe batatas]|uniref:uncharacterized protein n=1 Tax=Diaporthe batatas TaxID=748121 RepID=UPI001D045B30|nr:uncharacterized protein KVR01_008734 [Diaporthe batatas]KAG8161747.1 hypothetical protein KVR01_008734 [Diaporthe batatas]
MRATRIPGIWGVLFCFLLCFHVALAGVAQPLPRQDDIITDAPASAAPSSTTEDAASASFTISADNSAISGVESSPIPSSISATETGTPVPTVTGGTTDLNSTLFNITIAAGELPLKPRVTPGFSVAGVILILTGTAYTLIGIKTRWLHCFLSAGFLAAVGVTVLIIYVMNPPISNGVQGAYVVAATGTGLLLGGAALVFKEVTECLACLLGGFCLAMWLLTLKEGGLLGSGGAPVTIFIAVFSAASFAGYFSRWTRAHFMIACISLSGATAVVMGIDCFSRAGLKEYWAWVWNINDKLFPFGADTYPLTRGIKVEQAVTIIIALIGLVSQNKLWLVVKAHRAKKEEERIRAEAENQEHEANVGRDVEMATASERKQWEAVYGSKSGMGVHTSEDSNVGDIYHERKARNSGTTTTATATRRSTIDEREEIELAEIPIVEEQSPVSAEAKLVEERPEPPPKPKTAAEKVLDRSADGMVTVRVAADDDTLGSPAAENEEKFWLIGDDGEARLVPKASAEFRAKSSTPTPNLVSLPFRVPAEAAETVAGGDDDQSSVAAIADHDGDFLETRSTASRRSSIVNRLSVGSVDLFRRISQRSLGRRMDTAARGKSASREDLTSPVKEDNESIAATLDGSDEGSIRAVTPTDEKPFNKEIKAELAGERTQEKAPAETPASGATVSTDILKSSAADQNTTKSPDANATLKPSLESMLTSEKADAKKVEDASPVNEESVSKAGKSIASETSSVPVSLTKDRLPRGLSKVALSYRTNEWAKHLSNAEMPSPAELRIPHEPEPELIEVKEVEEKAAPVDVNELKKTALDATPPPAMPRSVSRMSVQQAALAQGHLSPAQRVSSDVRRVSGRAISAMAEDDDTRSIMSIDSRNAARSAAAAALTGEAVSGTPAMTASGNSSPPAAKHISSRPPVPGLVSYDSPQTLIGQRDMLMRKKASVLRPDSVQAGKVSPPSSNSASESGSVRGIAPSPAYGSVAAMGPPQAWRNHSGSGNALPSRRSFEMGGMSSGPALIDADDLPLSQRKAMMRQDSRTSINSGSLVGGANFNSHQPQRTSNLPSQAARESQLASFRQSVQQDLRSASAGQPAVNANAQLGHGGGFNPGATTQQGGGAGGGGGGPLINSIYGVPGTSSANSLPQHVVRQSYDAEVQRDIDTQRSFMMGQRQAEAQKQATLKSERERAGRMFEQRIRSDRDLMEMHREAMRKMQRRASQADRPMQ